MPGRAGAAISVLHVNHNTSWRGGERQTFLAARSLRRHGVASYVAAPPASALLKAAGDESIPALALRMAGEWDLGAALRIRKFVVSNRIDIVHAHTAHALGVSAWALVGMRGVGLVATKRVDRRIRNNFLSRAKYARCDRLIAISEKIRCNLLDDGIDGRRVVRIYSGIDLAKFEEAAPGPDIRAEYRIPGGVSLVGTVAAMTREKGLRTFLDAAAEVIGERPDTYFVLVGSGPQDRELRGLAAKLGIEDRVVFAGHRPDAERLIASFDLFVLPSLSEGLGSSVLDAMAAGVPVAASCTGGVPEMIEDRKSGMLFEPGSSASLSRCIVRVLGDDGLRAMLVSGARERVKAFDIEKCAAEIAQVYREVKRERAGK